MWVETTLYIRPQEINHANQIKGKYFPFRYEGTNEGDINIFFRRNGVICDVKVSGSVFWFKGRDNSVGIVSKLLDTQEIVVR